MGTRLMADSPKSPKNVAPADTSRIAKPIRSTAAPLGETARAANSVPAPVGPFATLPMKFGRYEIQKELGRGQMGAVYLARDVELDRSVALKVARVSLSGSANLLKRMEIEAKSAAKVDHPQICKVYDAGVIDGIRFIALQYIEGENLKQYMKRLGRKREPEEALRLILQILQALEAAHEQGVIHRDLKPENIMLNLQNEPVIMDFGLARKTIASSDAGLTQGMIVGTAAYMSPEQATGRAESIDHRSDLYAVGVMLFEMLTGEWPFSGGAIEVMGKKFLFEPRSPLDLNPKLDPNLAVICKKMIAMQKTDRYVTCSDVITALEQVDLNSAENDGVESSKTSFHELKNVTAIQSPSMSVKTLVLGEQARNKSAPLVSQTVMATNTDEKPPAAILTNGLMGHVANLWNTCPMAPFWTSLVGAVLFVLIVMSVIFFPTPYGIVQIEIDDPSISVKFEGATITVDNDNQPIRVTPTANHTLEVLQNGVTIESATRSLTVKRRDKQIVKVSLIEGNAVVIVDGKPVTSNVVDSAKPEKPVIEPDTLAKPRSDENRVVETSIITSKSTGMKLKLIPAGTFQMGSPETEESRTEWESPTNTVEITRPFYMGIYEVTQEEYERVMGVNPSYFSSGGRGSERVHGLETRRFPAEQVRWYDAIDYCNQLSVLDGYTPYYQLSNVDRNGGFIQSADVEPGKGNGYRLPTEAEWEYACRANTTTPFHFGEFSDGNQANVNGNQPYGSNLPGHYLQRTTTVGTYQSNEFGLFDMHGNVNEWCFDVADFALYGSRTGVTKDPVVLGDAREKHMIRGGSWSTVPVFSRSAMRGCNTPNNVIDCDGFRVVLDRPASISTGQVPGEARELAPGMKFRWCPPGRFTMGSPNSQSGRSQNEEQVDVTLTSGFWLSETEVTQHQWVTLMNTAPWNGQENVLKDESAPATYISHGDSDDGGLESDSASEFCRRLTEREKLAGRLSDDWKYVLPTEAQWEYACRAGTNSQYNFGDDEGQLGEFGWSDENARNVGENFAHRVGVKIPNAWGLCDMHGNVWEWCADWYHEKLPGGSDPLPASRHPFRLCRGGCWRYVAQDCCSATRNRCVPRDRYDDLGFRVAAVRRDQ